MTKIYFILIFLISFVTVYAQNESDSAQVTAQTEMPQSAAVQTFPTKTEADSAYIRNDFAASVEMYENILKNEGESDDDYLPGSTTEFSWLKTADQKHNRQKRKTQTYPDL